MAQQIQNVLVAGVCLPLSREGNLLINSKPNGSLGDCIVRHLKKNNFNTTLLTRNLDKTKSTFPGLTAIQVDYDAVDGLTEALHNGIGKQDALIILINRDQAQAQINLIDAAIAVGIPHIIPSAFGFTTRHPAIRESPVLAQKALMEDYLVQKAEEGRLTYTQVQTGAFFDWALDRGVYLNTKDPNARTMIFDGGDVRFSATNVDDIGKAVTASLLNIDQVKNKDVHIQTVVITQNQLLAYARGAAPDRDFKVLDLDTAELERQGFERYNSGDKGPETMRMFIPRFTFGKGMGLFEKTDNSLLGIQQWNEDQIKEFIAGYLK